MAIKYNADIFKTANKNLDIENQCHNSQKNEIYESATEDDEAEEINEDEELEARSGDCSTFELSGLSYMYDEDTSSLSISIERLANNSSWRSGDIRICCYITNTDDNHELDDSDIMLGHVIVSALDPGHYYENENDIEVDCEDIKPNGNYFLLFTIEEYHDDGYWYIINKIYSEQRSYYKDAVDNTDTKVVHLGKFDTVRLDEVRIDNLEFVDLGLSVDWAEQNVNIKGTSLWDYNDASIIASHYESHYGYRLPTKNELCELIGNCEWEWHDDYENKGATATNERGILYFPAEGIRDNYGAALKGQAGHYWSSNEKDNSDAYGAAFTKYEINASELAKSTARSVRLVRDKRN